MGKHFFKETTASIKESQYHRVIYCEWCGIVVWDFSRHVQSVKELQENAGNGCKASDKEPLYITGK